jgi:hypothetical protein
MNSFSEWVAGTKAPEVKWDEKYKYHDVEIDLNISL